MNKLKYLVWVKSMYILNLSPEMIERENETNAQ